MKPRRLVQFPSQRSVTQAQPALAHPIGAIAWRLTDDDGNLQTCEICPPVSRTAAWQVVLSLNATRLFTRPCAGRAEAEFVAQALREDQLLGGARPVGHLRHFSTQR